MIFPHSILVVDDEEMITKSLNDLLEHYGYYVVTANNGSECLQILSAQHFDLVILDIVMPGMSGIEVLQKIKEKHKDTEVIMITGYADKERAIAAFRLDAYDLIEKPYGTEEILNTIANCLKQLELRKEIEKKSQELKESEKQLRGLTKRLAESEEAERNRLARELHDQVGQNLTALGINLNIVRAHMSKGASSQIFSRLDDSLELVEQTTERIRNMMTDLKPPVLEDYGLVAALRWYGAQFSSRASIHIDVKGEEPQPRLTPHVENAMFRIFQEALTNVAKHAQATQVTIILEVNKKTVRLVITDNGIGFKTAQLNKPGKARGWGLLTMSERAEAIGGRFHIESRPGQSTRVMVEVAR